MSDLRKKFVLKVTCVHSLRDHMMILVAIHGQRYIVDVGFGTDSALQPLPLQHNYEFEILSPRRGRLEYRALKEHTDPNQRVWVYSLSEDSLNWVEQYCFTETEFFPADFGVMNFIVTTLPTSFFVQTVLAMRSILNEQTSKPEGVLTLHAHEIKRRTREGTELLETLKNEEQRVEALEKYFGLVLSQTERLAIKGTPSELKQR